MQVFYHRSLLNHGFYNSLLLLDNPFGDLKSYAATDNRLVERGSIIAVSYEARAKGVKRIMRGNEAKKVSHVGCGHIWCIIFPCR
jgi:nucleotidyltransferase/DNA polymerase involved in DNA repair